MMTKLLVYGYCVGCSVPGGSFSCAAVYRRGRGQECRILFRIPSAASACASRSLICERRSFPSSSSGQLIALCLLALALIFVPSSATRPTFNAPASSAIFRTCSKSPSSVFKWILPEIGYGAEVRLIIRRQHPEGDIFHQSPFWLVRIAAAEVVWAVVQSHPCRDEAASWMGHPQLRWCWLRKSWGGPPARACSSYRPPVCAHAAS